MSKILNSILWLVVGILVGMAAQTHNHHATDKAYVYLDVDKIISSITKKVANDNTPQEELNAKISQMNQQFESTLADYEKTHNVIIFSSPKPIKGAVDKTDYFIERVLKSNESGVDNK